MTPNLAHLPSHITEEILKMIKVHLQAFAKDESDIGEFKLFQVRIDVMEGMSSLQKCRTNKLHQIEPYMANLISSKADKFSAKLTSYLRPTKAYKHIEKLKMKVVI